MDKFENPQTQNVIFTKWFNNKLKKVFQPSVNNLVDGFKSGRRFYSLVNVLCECENLEIPEQFDDRQLISRGLENINKKFKMSLSSTMEINIDDIINGEENVILILSWWMISGFFANKRNVDIEQIENDTLFWCQNNVKGYRGVSVTNFTNSWRDGCALLAIIHHHKHNLFEFESRLSKTSGQNLTLALHLATQEFNCTRLLELDNFTMSLTMDWKCICLLLMEFRQCIEAMSENTTPSVEDLKNESIDLRDYNDPSNPSFQNMLINFEDIFKNTNDIMNNVLQKISPTENRIKYYEEIRNANQFLEKFDKDQELFIHLKVIKESAVEHESLMEMLAKHQETVQDTLLSGNELLEIRSVENTESVTINVKEKLQLITNKWNDLYKNATILQKKLRKFLYNIQMAFLIKIEDCIDKLEEIKKSQNMFGNTIEMLKEQLKINRSMEVEIESTEKFIAELQNFLVYNDDSDSSGDEEKIQISSNEDKMKRISKSISHSSFEQHIQSIGSKWNTLVSWVHCRYNSLQKTLLSWRHFEEEIQTIFDWLEERICSADQLIRKSSKSQFNDFVNYSESRWGRSISNLDKCAQKIKDSCNNEPEVIGTIDAKMDTVVQEWNDVSEKWRDSMDHWIGAEEKKRSNRAASFSEMSSENCSNRRNTEKVKKNTQACLSDMNINMAPVQAAYKIKFEADAERMMAWLENSAEKLELITLESISPVERPTIEEQRKIIDAVSDEMKQAKSKKSIDSIKRMGLMYQEDLMKSGENTDEIEQLFEELDERWSYLESQLMKSRQKVITIELSSDFEKRSSILDVCIKNVQDYLRKIPNELDFVIIKTSIQDLLQLKHTLINEKNSLKVLTEKYSDVKAELSKLNEEIIDKLIVELNYKIINQIENIENEQVKLKNNKTIMEMNLMPTEQWLSNTSEKVNSKVALTTFDSLTKEIEKFKSLEIKLEYHAELLFKYKISDSSSQQFNILTDLQKSSRNLGARLSKRLLFLNDLLDKCNQWQNQINEFDQWLTDVNSYLNEFEKQDFVGEEFIKESIKETEGGIQDLQNLLPSLKNIEKLTSHIEAYCSKEFKAELNNKKLDLQKIWESTLKKYITLKEELELKINDCNAKLNIKAKYEIQKVAEIVEPEIMHEINLVDIDMEHSNVLSDSSGTNSDTEPSRDKISLELIEEITEWIASSSFKLKRFSRIDNNEELKQFGSLIEEIKKSKVLYKEKLNEKNSNIIFNEIKDKMCQFSKDLEEEAQRYSSSNYHLQSFQSILSDEDSWVGKVNHVVQQSLSCNHLDVEELSENIDEIERVVCDHSEEDVNRLEDLKSSLMNARVLERSVSMEFDQIKEKSTETKDKAKQHLSSLQQLLDHLQSVERRVSQMTTWIHDTTNLIKSRISADLLGADSPDEFDILKQNFEDWEKFLQEMKDLEQGKRFQGRKEASERLRLQRFQLGKLLAPLKELFSRYSRPGDFEPRLNNLRREVNRVGEQIYLLDIISISPDDLESCVSHAKQFRESLIAEEEDLIYVYDLGKKIAERKEIEFAERFSLQLDSLKKKYYNLLEQIKDAEEKLIKAKPLIKELYNNVEKLDNSLESIKIKERSNVNMEEDLKLVSNVEEICEKLKAYTDYEKSDLVKDMFDEIKEKCDELISTTEEISMIESKEIMTMSELCEEADQLLEDIKDYDFSDKQSLEEKLDSIYDKTSQLRQAASQIMSVEVLENGNDQSTKYDYLQQKLETITEIITSHQSMNGRIKYEKTVVEDDILMEEKEIKEEIICSNSAGSLNQEISTGNLGSLENSYADSLSSPVSTEDMSNTENLVSDVSYTVHAVKIEQSILHQVSTEMKDHIHSFILFCQNNLGFGLTLSPGAGKLHAVITTTSELRAKINIFREQRLYLDHRLRELSAYAETSDQMEELDKIQRYWQESIGKLNKRIDRLTELDKRLEAVEESFKDHEAHSSEKMRTKVLRLIGQIEEELNVNLQKDKLRVTSHNRLGNQDSITKSNSSHSMNTAMVQDLGLPGDGYRDNLKMIREQLKEVGKRLNSVRISIDDSRRGCVSKLAERIQEIDDNLNDSSHILADVQYNISSGLDHQNNDAINLNFLIEAQKKRLTKYNNEFHSNLRKWMENATKWQEFIERLEGLQIILDDVEQELVSVINCLDYSEQEVLTIKKSLNSFEKKLVQLEQDGEKLSISCNDVDADFIHNRLSDLRSSFTQCLQSNRCSKLGLRLLNDEEGSLNNSETVLFNGNISDSASMEKIDGKSLNDLKQSHSSEVDLNANTIHSSGSTFTNEEFDSVTSGSSEELSTMIDGAATILDGRLENWAKITSGMVNSISVSEFDCIEALEKKIIDITVIKKEALERTAQITMTIEKHSINDSNSISAELSSNQTEESNSQLLSTYQDLKNNLYVKINQLCEIKAQYYHIKEQFNTLRNISKEFDIKEITDNVKIAIKTETTETKIKPVTEIINKMPKGLRESLQLEFNDIELEFNAFQEQMKENNENHNQSDEYNFNTQMTQENINQIVLLLKSINTFMIQSKINLGHIEDIDQCLENIKVYYDQLDRHRGVLQAILDIKVTNSIYSNNNNDTNFLETVDRVDRLWNNTENKLQQREDELIKMRELKSRLDEMETSLTKWMQESDGKLNQLLSEGANAKNQKILDDVKNGIPNWQQTLNHYQSLSYDLTNTYSTENCQDLEKNLERMNRHWSTVMSKLAKCSREISCIKSPLELSQNDLVEVTEVSSSMANESQNELGIEKLSGWLTSLEGQLETIEMGIVRWRSGSGSVGTTNSDKLKLKVITQLNEMQNEINHYENQFQSCSESEKNDSEYQIANRWKILKEKVNEIRQTLEGTPGSGQQLLTTLRLLNDWLAHKEADFLEQKDSPCNNYTLAHNQLRKFDTFLTEVESHKSQIEEAIEQTQNKIGEIIDPNKFIEQINVESEGDSDNSDTGSSTNTTDDKSKKLHRRLRRHLHHMKRKWIEINLKTKEFHEILLRKVQLLKSIESQIKESEQLISEIEFHIDSWSQVSTINSSILSQEMAQTKTLLQSTQPIIDKFNSIDSLRGQLYKLKIILTDSLNEELEKISSRISCIKSLCETRIKQLHKHEIISTKHSAMLETQPGIFHHELPIDSNNSISRKINFPHGLSENRKFIELENESVSYPWERCLHPSGSEVPYYKNHSTQDTQWDHPIMAELIKSFEELNTIRFSAYRTAMKLRALQKTLCMDLIDLSLVADTFRMSGLSSSSVNERLLDVGQIIVFLASLYRPVNQKLSTSTKNNGDNDDKASHSILGCARGSSIRHSRTKEKSHHTRSSSFGGFKSEEDKHVTPSKVNCMKSPSKTATSQAVIMKCSVMASVPATRTLLSNGENEINVPICVDLALNWLLNVYDGARNGKIRVLSLKVAVVIMSNAYLDEKYKYLFSLICNNQGQLDSTRLTLLLNDCILLPKHLNESSNFGTESVEPSVLSCFKNSIDAGPNRYIRLSHFLSWLKLEPQSLVWLPVLHRLISAECAVHQAKCGVCKIQPIVGLRYRCLRCFNFDLCQACFFYSKTGKGHKVSHPMQEYCNVTSSKENIRDYSRIFRNRFRSKSTMRRHPKLGYLPVQSATTQEANDPKIQPVTNVNPESLSTNHQIHSRVERYANRLAEVEQLNRTHSGDAHSEMPAGMNNLLLLPDSINRTKDYNKNDEEHRLIAKYTDTLRSQMRNESIMPPKCTMNNATQPKLSMHNSMETLQAMPPFQKSVSEYYAIPSNKNVPDYRRLQCDQEIANSLGIMSNSVINNIEDPRVQNSNASLNRLIHGLESQKRQLLDEYERLQTQTPINNYNIPKSPYMSMNQAPRYANVDLGPNIGSRGTPFNQSLPPISSRTTSRPYGAFSNTASLERSGSTIPSTDLISEAKMLREHKGKLENRMGLLELRNRQLENQLNMLRQLIDDSPNNQNRMLCTPSNNILNSFLSNINYDQDAEMLTAAQYAASKRINEISCVSPNAGMNYNNINGRYAGSSDNDMTNRGYPYTNSAYSGPRTQTSQNFYGSLERGSSYKGVYDSTPVGTVYRTPIDRVTPQPLSSTSYHNNHQMKAASDTGGSLSDSDFQLMCRSLADSCPTVTATPTYGQSTNSIGSLFHMAGQVGKAVGQLVNVMTDDFNNSQNNISGSKVVPNTQRVTHSSVSLISSPFNEDFVLPTSQSIINNSNRHFSDSN